MQKSVYVGTMESVIFEKKCFCAWPILPLQNIYNKKFTTALDIAQLKK
jgi:hypothetical protein